MRPAVRHLLLAPLLLCVGLSSAAAQPATPTTTATTPPSTSASPTARAVEERIALREIDLACVRIVQVTGAAAYIFDSSASRVRRLAADVTASHGTGFFVDASGIIATAAHVVAGGHAIAVIFTGQDEPRPAQILYVDPEHDIAFLQVDVAAPAVVPVPAAVRRFIVTEPVFTSGFPLDVRERYPAAISGVVGRENNDGSLYTSLSVNPGNSGGPVTDGRGQLVGLVSRGSNVRSGAQGFGLLEPLRFILPGLTIARELATTRFEPPTASDRQLARVMADLVGTDTERRLFERTPLDVIVQAAEQPRAPEVAMIIAAHAWNVHVALLEHHRVRDITQLPIEDQAVASRLRSLALRLTQEAFNTAPYLRVSYDFGRSLLVQADRSFVVRASERR